MADSNVTGREVELPLDIARLARYQPFGNVKGHSVADHSLRALAQYRLGIAKLDLRQEILWQVFRCTLQSFQGCPTVSTNRQGSNFTRHFCGFTSIFFSGGRRSFFLLTQIPFSKFRVALEQCDSRALRQIVGVCLRSLCLLYTSRCV